MTEPLTGDRELNMPLRRPRPVPQNLEASLRRDGFDIGAWHVDPRTCRMRREDHEQPLDPRQIDLLVALATQPGEVLTRDELLSRVWGDTHVSENSLTQAVSRLRKALGDDRTECRYIETISKSGYRLVADVRWSERPEPPKAVPALSSRSTTPARPTVRRGQWVAVAGVVLAIAASWFSVQSFFAVSPAPSLVTTRPELTLVGNQFGPRLSPDGEQLAFAWQGPEQADWDIWVQPIGDDNPVRITDNDTDERLATWSPDGRSLAFVSFSSDPDDCGIFIKPILGGPAERLADCYPGMRSLDWSPTGDMLVFNGGEVGGRTRSLYTHDLATGVRRRLTTPVDGTPGDSSAVISADGTQVAFRREHSASRHDVMVIPIDAADDRQAIALTDDRWGRLRGVDWSRDNQSVVFSSDRNGRYRLWRVPVDGGEPELLPVVDTWVTQPSIARQSGRMIYRTFRDSVDIWELALDELGTASGEPTRRVPSSRSERHPAGSPQGDAVAFVSDRSGTHELWSGRPDGVGLMRHTELGGPLPAGPSWSPDGKQIVYDAAPDGHSDLWVVASDSRRPTRITANDSEDRNPVFSHDGSTIYFTSDRSGEWEIWRMPAAGGEATRVTPTGGFRAQPSPDGESLFFVKLDQPGIWSMPADGGEAVQLVSDFRLSEWGNWVPGRQGIYYVTRSPTTIAYLDFATRQTRTVHQPAKQIPYLGRALSLSSEEKSILFSMIDHSDDEVMTVESARF